MHGQLDQAHRDEFIASGLTDQTIKACMVHSGDSAEIKGVLGWAPKHRSWGRGWIMPFPFPFEQTITYQRVKLDRPRADGPDSSDVIKYESPTRVKARVYFPPGVFQYADDANTPLVITEGEKKALKVWQHGTACIGLTGVAMWAQPRASGADGRKIGPKILLPDMQRWKWKDRRVYIAFDSDAEENWHVRVQQNQLAEMLVSHGADVQFFSIPSIPGNPKTGIDDFLVYCERQEDRDPDAAEHALSALKDTALVIPEACITDDNWLANQFLLEECFEPKVTNKGFITVKHWRGDWYQWKKQENIYVKREDSFMQEKVRSWISHRGISTNDRKIVSVCKVAALMCHLDADIENQSWLGFRKYVSSEYTMGFKNCTVQIDVAAGSKLESGEQAMSPATPEWFSTSRSTFDYDWTKLEPCPKWMGFLQDVWGDDEASKAVLQEWMGWCMCDIAGFSPQKMLLLHGPPASGKGTILRVLSELVGPEAYVGTTLDALGKDFGLETWTTANVVAFPDARVTQQMVTTGALSTLLSITGGDRISVGRKFKKSLQATIRARIILSTNELPSISDGSYALSRRICPLVTTESAEGIEDETLTDRLLAELPGIFWWALEGWSRLNISRKLTMPDYAESVKQEFSELSSPMLNFITDNCRFHHDLEVSRDKIYDRYKEWCADVNCRPVSVMRFMRDFKSAIGSAPARRISSKSKKSLKFIRKEIGGRFVRYIQGIGIVS